MTLVIAEAGVNHNGDEKLAFELIDAAYEAGADIVKFQTFKAAELATKDATQAQYQVLNTAREESQLDMLRRLELPYDAHHRLMAYCDQLGIEFLSTAFDMQSLGFLVDDLGLRRLKIPSGEITNAPFILAHARTGLDLIISTGMASLAEIEMALSIIAFGYTAAAETQPSLIGFQCAYASDKGQRSLKDKVTVLHCTTEYPAPLSEINLKVLDTLRYAFDLPVGYSDHSEGVAVAIAAVACGAVLIEKHFTLDRKMDGPDHKASLEPQDLKVMISSIRDVDIAIGVPVKIPTVSEIKNKLIARKSIVASRVITLGELFSEDNLAIKRPGNGKSPILYWDVIGTYASKTYQEDEMI